MITFNISTTGALPRGMPYQITPSTRSYLTMKEVMKYPDLTATPLSDVVIHVNYVTRPFSVDAMDASSRCRDQLRLYGMLATRLGVGHILIHLPDTADAFINFTGGMQVIATELFEHAEWHGTVLLEMPAWRKSLLEYLRSRTCSTLYKECMGLYIDIIKHTIMSFNKRYAFKVILDTAHLYNDGCVVFDDMKWTVRRLEGVLSHHYIHFNGNSKAPFTSDEHIPVFTVIGNHMNSGFAGYDDMLLYVCTTFKVLICENNFNKYNVLEEYYTFASSLGIDIIPRPHNGGYVL